MSDLGDKSKAPLAQNRKFFKLSAVSVVQEPVGLACQSKLGQGTDGRVRGGLIVSVKSTFHISTYHKMNKFLNFFSTYLGRGKWVPCEIIWL